jgi:hypothetical protein
MSWYKAYQSFDSMTISELKELLKWNGLPVSGKKHDLISYLVFKDYPDLLREAHLPRKEMNSRGLWLKLKYEMIWTKVPIQYFTAINYQDINSKVA